jgi:outer membrane receptor protein involved in Fe transport
MEIGSINAININDVASVEIQRDGTLYGFKGVGGVIAIKTKSGSKR